nr:MAG TPA: hypothetical protein [Caudoviricetes sp.]
MKNPGCCRGFPFFNANHLQFKMCILYYCLLESPIPTGSGNSR